MNLLFITLAPLESNAGHLRHLKESLLELSKINKVSVLSLGKSVDSFETQDIYKKVSFFRLTAIFEGWKLKNSSEITKEIINLNSRMDFDLIVLQMEVWDLMRDLGTKLKGKVPFATVIHAMPFLSSPITPSDSFETDVISYSTSEIAEYRKSYIDKHYKETDAVFDMINLISSNSTVTFYLRSYFKRLKIFNFKSSAIAKGNTTHKLSNEFKYDFVYMARMEKGKGVEYLQEILNKIKHKLGRPIRIAILGRTDDDFSKTALDKLLIEKDLEVQYFGWADEIIKQQVLSQGGAFIYPSALDTYAIVLLEALQYGLPCVVWDVPFTRLNYSTKAVKKVKFLDYERFAEESIKAVDNRNELFRYALNFTKKLSTPKEIAKLDSKLFRDIVESNQWRT